MWAVQSQFMVPSGSGSAVTVHGSVSWLDLEASFSAILLVTWTTGVWASLLCRIADVLIGCSVTSSGWREGWMWRGRSGASLTHVFRQQSLRWAFSQSYARQNSRCFIPALTSSFIWFVNWRWGEEEEELDSCWCFSSLKKREWRPRSGSPWRVELSSLDPQGPHCHGRSSVGLILFVTCPWQRKWMNYVRS